MKLTKLQQKIINAPEDKIAVNACAAALKTSTLIEKVRKLLKDGIEPSSIAVITFTRMASAELIERLGDDYKQGLFVGTIHSLGARFLLLNGLGDKIKKIAEEEEFDKIFELCKNLDIYQSYDWICIDEAQDTGEKELEFIFKLINPKHYFCCFDIRQSIYGFKGARPDLLEEYLKNEATFYSLNENYRNGNNILFFAKHLIYPTGLEDDSISMVNNAGKVLEIEFNTDYILQTILSDKKFNNWAILTRNNSELQMFLELLKKNNIPCDTFKQSNLSYQQLEEKIEANTVKILTIHSSKGLAWPNVIVYGAKYYSNEERNICYVAATRAKDNLIWCKRKPIPKKRKEVHQW